MINNHEYIVYLALIKRLDESNNQERDNRSSFIILLRNPNKFKDVSACLTIFFSSFQDILCHVNVAPMTESSQWETWRDIYLIATEDSEETNSFLDFAAGNGTLDRKMIVNRLHDRLGQLTVVIVILGNR